MTTELARTEPGRDPRKRKVSRGIFALRCTATRQVWIEASPNLDGTHNGLLFFLRNGLHRDPVLQAAWRTHGEQTFRWEVLERLDDNLSDVAALELLDTRRREWTVKFKGLPIAG
jgi:hypothetical protein